MVEFDGLSNDTAEEFATLYPDDFRPRVFRRHWRDDLATRLDWDTRWKRASAYQGDKVMHAGRRLTSKAISNPVFCPFFFLPSRHLP